jgi:hypothetical protein
MTRVAPVVPSGELISIVHWPVIVPIDHEELRLLLILTKIVHAATSVREWGADTFDMCGAMTDECTPIELVENTASEKVPLVTNDVYSCENGNVTRRILIRKQLSYMN